MSDRVLEPEWLDELAPADLTAQQSRRDLRKLNFILGHRRRMVRLLRRAGAQERLRRLVDLGAGDGHFVSEVYRSFRWPDSSAQVVLVDRQLSVGETTRALLEQPEEISVDVFEFAATLRPKAGTFVMANLFLHHFEDSGLRELFAMLADKVDSLAACEPPRSWGALAAVRLLPLLGCNAVTRHDAMVSVRAGFGDRELSALWPQRQGWNMFEQTSQLTHEFVVWKA